MDAVMYFDVEAVRSCLQRGADPNYSLPPDNDDTPGSYSPSTPLEMVIFRISDNLLEDRDLECYAKIAGLLIQHEADPGPALALAESRYGKYDPGFIEDPFTKVWHVIARTRPPEVK